MYGLYKNVKHKPAIVKLAVIVTPNLSVAIIVSPKIITSNNADARAYRDWEKIGRAHV